MAINSEYKRAIDMTIENLRKEGLQLDYYLDLQTCCQLGFLYDTENKDYYKIYSDYIKEIALKEVVEDEKNAETWRNLYWEIMKLESFWYFESYLIYMEHKRPYERRFYEPRRKTQHIVAEDLQALEYSKTTRMYTLSEPARIGKSGMILFFLSWIILRHPHSHNAMGTYSGPAAEHFYKEILKIFTEDEYCFQELYSYFNPDEKFITDKSAEKMAIYFTGIENFPTICFRGIDGSWTGIIDVSDDGYLAVDDLIRDREHALSQTRTDKTFYEYTNKMMDRMHQGSKQLMIGTLWNVFDPIMRVMEINKDDPDYVFRRIPALDENDESNFDYEYHGYNTEYYRKLRDQMIKGGMEADWQAKFQQKPYRREGILFPSDELRMFNGILPVDHKYTFVTVCDVAFGGGDSVSMPIGLQDEDTGWIYIVDWYFSSSGVKITVPGVVDMLMKYGIKEITFEKNNGGQLYAQDVQEELEKRRYICSCNTKPAPNSISKSDKIKGCEGKIKAMLIFLDNTKHDKERMLEEGITYFERSPQYERAMSELSMFASIGSNDHDDAADSISQLCLKAFGDLNALAEVEVFSRAVIGF